MTATLSTGTPTPPASYDAPRFPIPTRDTVAAATQPVFDGIARALGFVPNLYATFAHSDTALQDYLALQNRRSSLTARERETINLVVSQVNDCAYCLAAHTALAARLGFAPEQILALRAGTSPFDARLDALARFVRTVVASRGHPAPDAVDAVLAAGYGRGQVIDVVMTIGDKIISNYLHGVTGIPVDFPAAPPLG